MILFAQRGAQFAQFLCFSLLLWLGLTASAQSNLKIAGMGFFENHRLAARLAFLQGLQADDPVALQAAWIEDSAFILLDQVRQAGYLQPALELQLWQGTQSQLFHWQSDYSVQVQATTGGERAVFRIFPGLAYYYDRIVITGVDSLSDANLLRFFIPVGVLLIGRNELAYTPENCAERLQRIRAALISQGYRAARLQRSAASLDATTGAVHVSAQFAAGPLYVVGPVTIEAESHSGAVDSSETSTYSGVALTAEWEQARLMELRNAAYAQGYPDAEVVMQEVGSTDSGANRLLCQLRFVVRRGEFVRLRQVRFEGDVLSQRSVLQRQANLKPGQPVNLLAVSEARRKLMALGIHQRVGYKFDPQRGPERDVVYQLDPSQLQELQLSIGWGSYEMARFGFNWEHRNPWGRAQRYELGAKQSFKSREVNLGYTVPQLLGTDLNAYAKVDYSTREELSYDRSTAKLSFGTSAVLAASGFQLSLEYGLALEDADRNPNSGFDSAEEVTVSSLRAWATLDRRDDFLAPTRGYNLFASLESAYRLLGGTVNFQKVEFGGGYHFPLNESLLLHFGLRTGGIFSTGAAAANIPFNQRFFWGGENSVRGYQAGGAAPLGANGDQVGAEFYVLGNFEFEQRIWNEFSALLFCDGLADARDGFFRQSVDYLYSVGLGLRYNTVVGPMRLEYGYNPQPEPQRRRATLHFSIGFPF